MNIFSEIGSEIERRWHLRNYDEQVFSELATTALEQANLPQQIKLASIYDWVFGNNHFGYQPNLGGFGWEPKLTMFYNPRFSIEMLFWVDATTTVHQHQFEGAFQVLVGSSIQSEYRFEQHQRVNASLLLGQLTAEKTELLRTGDVRPIRGGAQFIHSVFHLDHPSVSLLIRNATGLEAIPCFSYFHPGIAMNYDKVEPELGHRLGVLEVLRRTDHSTFIKYAESFLKDADFFATVRFLGQFGAELVSAGVLESMLALISERHGADRGNMLAKALTEFNRQRAVVRLRQTIMDREHRLFAAILLNAPNREGALRLLRQLDSASDPVKRMVDWVRTLAVQNKLGIDLDEPALQVFECLLHGLSAQNILERRDNGGSINNLRDADIESISGRLAREPIFQTLFR